MSKIPFTQTLIPTLLLPTVGGKKHPSPFHILTFYKKGQGIIKEQYFHLE